jgi:hypothetical protein
VNATIPPQGCCPKEREPASESSPDFVPAVDYLLFSANKPDRPDQSLSFAENIHEIDKIEIEEGPQTRAFLLLCVQWVRKRRTPAE